MNSRLLTPRRLTKRSIAWPELAAATASAFVILWILFNEILHVHGVVGFQVLWIVGSLVLFANLTRRRYSTREVHDQLFAIISGLAATLVLVALFSTLLYTLLKGLSALVHLNFWTQDMSGVAPTAPLNQGGVLHAIVGTLIEVALAVVISLPLGVATAIYLSEIGGRGSSLVRTVIEAMTALPEILAGLFVYVVFVVGLGMPKSGWAATLAMAITMIPIVARASEVALRVVPKSLRDASRALGVPEWRTTLWVILPTARAGLVTALLLSIARGVGETAIPLIVSGASSFTSFNPFSTPMNSLPLFVFTAYSTHEPIAIARGFGAATVLLLVVVGLFLAARQLGQSKKGM